LSFELRTRARAGSNGLQCVRARGQAPRMGLPSVPVTLSPVDVEVLNKKLSEARHNINNHLSMVVAAVELMKIKPEMAPRMIETLGKQPDRIVEEMRKFSDEFEKTLQITPPEAPAGE
jgi:hypothetical protein